MLSAWTASRAISQPITPAGDGTGTVIVPDGNEFSIQGGARSGSNLFHSFDRFDLDTGQTANFISPGEINNIFGRVVGGQVSVIDGLLQVSGSDANLFLTNPAGIIFGENARLDVPGDFTATTATGIGFGDRWLRSGEPTSWGDFVSNPTGLEFANATPGSIFNFGSLAVTRESNLSLIAGAIANFGNLSAPNGDISLVTVPGQNLVRLGIPGNPLYLEILPNAVGNSTGNSLDSLLAQMGSHHADRLTRNADGSVVLAGSALVVEAGDIVVSETTIDARSSTVSSYGNLFLGETEINTSGDLNLLATDTVTIRDRFGATVGGNLQIRGDRAIDILALNASRFPFAVGGDLYLSSDGIISGDTRFSVGGDLAILDLAGDGGTFLSLFDPILFATGNVTFGDYTGVALKIEAGGSITGNNITITGPDTELDASFASDPDFEVLSTSAALILRSGVANPGNSAVPDGFETDSNPTSPANITVGNIATNSGPVILSATGAISTGVINTLGDTGGGNITIEATENIDTGILFSSGGDVSLQSNSGSVSTADIFSNAVDGGNIRIVAAEEIQANDIDAEGLRGTGGNITLEATGNIVNESLDARGLTNGGNINITTEGTVRVTDVASFGIIRDEASIVTSGEGSVTIDRTGEDNIPFVVGDASENGTAGTIAAGETVISSGSIEAESFTRGNVTISNTTTGGTNGGDDGNGNGNGDGNNGGNGDGDNGNGGDDPDDPDSLIEAVEDDIERLQIDANRQGSLPVSELVLAPEARLTQDFERYLGLPPTAKVSISETRRILQEVEEETGDKPTIAYVRFVPRGLSTKSLPESSIDTEPDPEDILEVLTIDPEGEPQSQVFPTVSRDRVINEVNQLRYTITNPRLRRTENYLPHAQQLYDWLVRPLEPTLEAQEVQNITFIMEEGLRSLPIAALHDGEQFVVQKYSLGYMPSLSLTDTRRGDVRSTRVLAMGASEFPGTDLSPLPAVPTEIELVASQLWRGDRFLNEEFTLENLRSQRRRTPYGIVHLATHGEFNPGDASNSYIQLWETRLGLDQLRTLNLDNPPVELLVLSACRTAVGSTEAELGFAGLAIAAGVKSALGSFWYVSDEGTLALMTEFYHHLATAPTKADALRQAQESFLEGEVYIEDGHLVSTAGRFPLPPELQEIEDVSLSHPYYWSAFVVIGNPW